MDNLNNLIDLEVLLLKIEDKEIRNMVEEAIKSYYVGAYRASINSIWNAIIYDAYKKAKFLVENFGDREAGKLVREVENSIKSGNYIKEFKIIEDYLYKKFEALDEVDLMKLKFIKELRNLSSHPSFFVREGKVFNPNAEEVRMCIRNSIEVLLSKKPIIGKSAITHILTDIQDYYMPLDYESFKEYIEKKYINRADRYLLRNLFLVILKDLNTIPDETIKNRLIWLLKLLIKKNRDILSDEKVKNILNNYDVNVLIQILIEIPSVSEILDEIVPKLKKALNENIIKREEDDIFGIIYTKLNLNLFIFVLKNYKLLKFNNDEIRELIYNSLENVSIDNDNVEKIIAINDKDVNNIFLDFFIENLKNLTSFRGAEDFIKTYGKLLKFLHTKEKLEILFENIKLNQHPLNQILDAGQKLSNLIEIFKNLPDEVLKENRLLINDFFEYLKSTHSFSIEEITELNNLIEARIQND